MLIKGGTVQGRVVLAQRMAEDQEEDQEAGREIASGRGGRVGGPWDGVRQERELQRLSRANAGAQTHGLDCFCRG
jgi:hypothetical protein